MKTRNNKMRRGKNGERRRNKKEKRETTGGKKRENGHSIVMVSNTPALILSMSAGYLQ